MTPFKIRRRLKSLFGLDSSSAPARPERPKYTVSFELPNGDTFEVEAKEGDSLVLASGRGAYPIATGCADSTCGTCRVEVLAGHDQLSSESALEKQTKQEQGIDEALRLGCQTAVLGAGVRAKIINVLGEELVE